MAGHTWTHGLVARGLFLDERAGDSETVSGGRVLVTQDQVLGWMVGHPEVIARRNCATGVQAHGYAVGDPEKC